MASNFRFISKFLLFMIGRSNHKSSAISLDGNKQKKFQITAKSLAQNKNQYSQALNASRAGLFPPCFVNFL